MNETLLNFRATHNLSQTAAANILGVSPNMVYRYEKGISKPSKMREIQMKNKMKNWEENKNENL